MSGEHEKTKHHKDETRIRRHTIKRVPPPQEFEHLAEALRDRFAFFHIS